MIHNCWYGAAIVMETSECRPFSYHLNNGRINFSNVYWPERAALTCKKGINFLIGRVFAFCCPSNQDKRFEPQRHNLASYSTECPKKLPQICTAS